MKILGKIVNGNVSQRDYLYSSHDCGLFESSLRKVANI